VEEALAVDGVLFALVEDDLIDALFAEVAAEIVLVVFVGAAREMFGPGAHPPLEAQVVDVLH
jgi:hypothetical protein